MIEAIKSPSYLVAVPFTPSGAFNSASSFPDTCRHVIGLHQQLGTKYAVPLICMAKKGPSREVEWFYFLPKEEVYGRLPEEAGGFLWLDLPRKFAASDSSFHDQEDLPAGDTRQ